MSFPNQDLTLHELHKEFNPNCESCDLRNVYKKAQVRSYYDTPAYKEQILKVWNNLMQKYPERYKLGEYVIAKHLAGFDQLW